MDEFDGGGVLTEGVDLLFVDGGFAAEAVLGGADGVQDVGVVVAGFGLVDVLEADVVAALGFHVRDGAGEGEEGVGLVEEVDCVGDDPEVGGLG